MDVPRSTFYYASVSLQTQAQAPQNALSAAERENVHPLEGVFLAVVNSERFCNDSPRVISPRPSGVWHAWPMKINSICAALVRSIASWKSRIWFMNDALTPDGRGLT